MLKRFSRALVLFGIALLALPVFAQEAVPATQPLPQEKVKLTKEQKAEKDHEAALDKDREMGKKYAAEALKEYKPTKDKALQDRVDRIGQELAQIANANPVDVIWGDKRMNTFDYKFYVVEGKEVNAFSLPGGTIFVFEGLLKFTESDDELAGVLAHEISHASFRHIATLERESSKLSAITLPLILIAILAGGESGMNAAQGGQLANQAMASAWSVKAEKAADFGGVQYMIKSKYNPAGILTFMERLAYVDRNKAQYNWGIYQTHPPSRERANSLIEELGSFGVTVNRSKVTQTLSVQTKPLPDKSFELSFAGFTIAKIAGPDSEKRAAEISGRVNRFMDTVPGLNDLALVRDQLQGRGQRLFTLTPADAAAMGMPLEKASTEALAGLKKAIYDLNYRVWSAY